MTMDKRPMLAVGAAVVRDGSLLMVRRGQAPNEGLWTIPGGRVEDGELLEDALKREVLEETGLRIEVGKLLGILEVPGDPHYVILDYICTAPGDAEPIAASDAAEARWVALDEVGGLRCTPRFLETMTSWGVLAEPVES